MAVGERIFGAVLAASRPLLPVAGLLSPKVARGVAERRGVVARLREWAEGRERRGSRVWLHGASAGELIGAVPAVEALRKRGDIELVVTYFSPSAESALPLLEPDVADVLPLDTPGETRRAVAALSPDAIVFAKLDVWPNLTRAAAARGVPLGMINGTVRPGSSRLGWPFRRLLSAAYGRLDAVGAATAADADRLARLGVREDALRVTGDGSFDWALARARRARTDPDSAAARLLALRPPSRPVVVAGSTWRRDEEVLLAALSLLDAETAPWMVIVPHEPKESVVRELSRECLDRLGREPIRWSALRASPSGPEPAEEGPPAPIVVDAVGLLAEMYAAADVSYVGGGFGDGGLHSVVEPAAAGAPVLVGPRHDRREARELLSRGGAVEVEDARELRDAIASLLANPDARERRSRAARRYVEEGAGAGTESARLVLTLLPGG